MKKGITICGRLSYSDCQSTNGQTIKSVSILSELKKHVNKVNIIDTNKKLDRLLCPFRLFFCAFYSSDIIVLLATRGLKITTPFLRLAQLLFHIKIHYVVIGGWLPTFLKKHQRLKKSIAKFDYIYVETKSMNENLLNSGFMNVYVMPNFKEITVLKKAKEYRDNRFKFCTFSRVMKEKGISDAIEAIINLKKKGYDCSLDIYGPIDDNQKEWFHGLKKTFPEYISYRGVVEPFNTTTVLSNYYCLLFPTYYEGEGFAGTIIDAMSAGLPIICSDWKYNREIITDGITGYLHTPNDSSSLEKCAEKIINNRDARDSLSSRCLIECLSYSPSNSFKVLLDNLSFNL